jgi:poly(hydroxyalkanoate) granule-associated protein
MSGRRADTKMRMHITEACVLRGPCDAKSVVNVLSGESAMATKAMKKGKGSEQMRARNTAGKYLRSVTDQASDTWNKLEQMFEERVSHSLNRLGVPTKKEIDELSKRVRELSAAVSALAARQARAKTAQKPARPAAPKRSTAR